MRIITLNLTMLTKIVNGIELFMQMFPERPAPSSIKFEMPFLSDEQIKDLLYNKSLEINNITYNLKPFEDEK
jgi:hypothetical protein